MVRYLLGVLFFILLGCSSNETVQPLEITLSIVPKLQEAKVYDGVFLFEENPTIQTDESLLEVGAIIKDYLNEITKLDIPLIQDQAENENSIKLAIDSTFQSEEYSVRSRENGLVITGGSPIGILNGFQTLRQLLITQSTNFYLPIMDIHDSPQFRWRGLLLDCSRHFMQKDFVKHYIDLLALYKMNVLHWHLTEDQGWRIEIKKYPNLTEIGAWRDDGNGGEYGGYYTQEDIKEIVEYAQQRGITVVPEIELPGHSQAALAAYPQYSCTGGPFEVANEWGVFKEIYCAGNDSTFQFLEDILSEVVELFPSKYIHIGGDEVTKYRWEHCKKCQRRIKEEGLQDEHELQSYFIQRIEKFLNSKGKQIIGWDEILEGGIAPGATVQSWRGFDGAREAVEHGHNAIVSPTSHAYFDYDLNDIDMQRVYDFNPVPKGVSADQAQLILGGECNMWSERAPQEKVDSKVFPRILAMSEVLWSDSLDRDYQEFRERVQFQYEILDKMGVNYGFEKVPVSVSTGLKNEQLMVVLNSYDEGLDISYHLDGKSFLYTEPISIDTTTEINITFSRNNKAYPDTIRQLITKHKGLAIKPEYGSEFSKSYTAGGEYGLTDGKKGSAKFRDGNWQGYWGPDVELIMDLQEIQTIQQFSSGYLQYNNAWIFLPTRVEYAYSTDGVTYQSAGQVTHNISLKEKKQLTKDFTLKIPPVQARYVKLKAINLGVCPDWHDAAGSKTWLFIDEFEVN